MIIGINKLKILTKYISYECKCKFEVSKCNSNQRWSNDKCWCESKNPEKHHACDEDYIWNPATCICENCEYLARTIDNLVITCDEIINVAYNVSTNGPENVASTASINFHSKKVRYKVNCYILHKVLLVVMLLHVTQGY